MKSLRIVRFTASILFLALFAVSLSSQTKPQPGTRNHSAAYNSMAQKLDRIARNDQQARPDPTPTRITAEEASAWMNEGGVKLPAGVDQVRFRSQPGVVTANARIDFDKFTASRASYNPLLSLFSGVHQVVVVAGAAGANGQASISVQTLTIDGVQVPRMAMELFVDHYLKPKYPNVGLDTRFRMPSRVDTAIVGRDEVTLTQR